MRTVAMHPQGARWGERRYEMHDALYDHAAFTNSGKTMRGDWEEYMPSTGHLPSDEVAKLRAAFDVTPYLYVVWSYATPIAWYSQHLTGDDVVNGWYIPNTKYSVTTSRHQNMVRTVTGDPYWR